MTDLILTIGVTAFAYDLNLGAIPPREVIPSWQGVGKSFNAESLMVRLRNGENADKVVESYAPQYEKYQRLRRALVEYRRFADEGGWRVIDVGLLSGLKDRILEQGSHDLVPLLRNRLMREGYAVSLPADADESRRYDPALRETVKQFQANRGLDADGIVGELTLKAMNIPVEELITKIESSMERLRWLPEDLGGRYILVNIPEFILRAYQDGKQELEMRVIVGDAEKGTTTPIFVDELEYVIFRPYWNVPRSIIRDELLPEIKKDPGYLKKFNYEIVDSFSPDAKVLAPSLGNIECVEKGELKIRQTAGPYNALGLVKLIFPNRFSVYLHDTNQRSLFLHSERDMSHGCIRVHEPETLAHFALSQENWTEEKVHEAMYGEDAKRQSVSLGEKIPVYILYLTAFSTTENGPLGFYSDVYRKDALMAEYHKN